MFKIYLNPYFSFKSNQYDKYIAHFSLNATLYVRLVSWE